LRQKTIKVTGEVKPSTQLDIGKALSEWGQAKLRAYQKEALKTVFGKRGPAELLEAFGIEPHRYRLTPGAGAYDGTVAPNEIIELRDVDRELARSVALAWMYIFRQNAAPFFRASEKADTPGVYFRFDHPLKPDEVRAFYDLIRAKVHPNLGHTLTNPDEIVVINYRDENGVPFGPNDETFEREFDKLSKSLSKKLGVTDYVSFQAETEYPWHDWGFDPEGRALRESLQSAAGSPDLPERLDHWANIFSQFAQQAVQEEPSVLRSRGGRPGEREGDRQVGLPGPRDEAQRLLVRPPTGIALPESDAPLFSLRPQQPDAVTVLGS
jgi:hypothetical protein